MLRRRSFLGLLGGGAVASMAARAFAAEPEHATGRLLLSPPTGQAVLDGSVRQGVFMDTGTGKPESGMFGNTRRHADGSPRFHEGIDIAPVQPWRRTQDPADVVRAAADGLVVYVNRHAANPSLYGNYVVLTHPVESFGEVYTLYAHLHHPEPSLKAGQRVRAGAPLGVMGHSPDFPLARAHLHFEIGVMMNRFYPYIDDQHGIWNGANLYGLDPCDAFAAQRRQGFFDVAAYLRARPVAFRVVVPEVPDYFLRTRKPSDRPLPAAARWIVDFSAEGIPLALRPAEGERAGCAPRQVLDADAQRIARGRPFVKNGRLTERGQTLYENLTFAPGVPAARSQQGEVG